MLSAARALPEISFAELRQREFSRLDRHRHVYLDYTGSALYGESQLRAHHELLRDGVFGNPHSEHRPSRASTAILDHARELVLRFLDVDARTHDVIFTANTTAAIKLVAESYPFDRDTQFVLSADNHNSINGIREYARRAGAAVRYLPLDAELRLADFELAPSRGLFAFPAQSNFSGVRHPLALVDRAKAAGFDVLLDIASYAPSHAVSLRDCPADFAVLSFYKLFGYPTGLGALIARREALARLRRPWFSGGTVTFASVQADLHQLRPRHEAFEDGTPNFLGIAALAPGFALIEEAGMDRISAHVAHLTSLFLDELTSLSHVQIYGPRSMHDRGGNVAFNLCDRDGNVIPFRDVELRATEANIAVRGGCFCNPGAAEAALQFEPGATAGAVRVSTGLANSEADIRRAIACFATFR